MPILKLAYFCCQCFRQSAKVSHTLVFFLLLGFGKFAHAEVSYCEKFYGLNQNTPSGVLDPRFRILNSTFFGLSSKLVSRLWNNNDVLRIAESMEFVTSGKKNYFYLDGLGYFITRAKLSRNHFNFEIALVTKEIENGVMEIGERNPGIDWLTAKTAVAALKVMLSRVQNLPQIEIVSMTAGQVKNEMFIEMAKRNGFEKVGQNYVKEVSVK